MSKRDEFVNRVAKEVLNGLSDKDKEYIFMNPNSDAHHFGLGLTIRNAYIYNDDVGLLFENPDNLSSRIISKIASMIIDNYDYSNPLCRRLYESFEFPYYRKLYYVVNNKFPDEIVNKYKNLSEAIEAEKLVIEEIKAKIYDVDRFKLLCERYNVSVKNCEMFIDCIDNHNKKEYKKIPYDFGLLTSNRLLKETRNQLLKLLKFVLDESLDLIHEIPSFVFNQKDAVMVAVSRYGKSLKRFPKFNLDHDVIVAALTNDGEAIEYVNEKLRNNIDYIKLALNNMYSETLKMPCMAEYRDDEELVKIALEANGCHIKYASDRLKDDFEMAKFAIQHQKDWYPECTVCHLSERLKDNVDLAIVDIKEGHGCIDSFSDKVRDNNKVAMALMKSEYAWKMYLMSDRVQKKYGMDNLNKKNPK